MKATFEKVGKWWVENKYYAGGITCVGVTLALLVALWNLGKLVHEHATRETVGWSTATIPLRSIPENQISKEDYQTLKSYRQVTFVGMPNETKFKLHGVFVHANRQGHVAVTDGKGDMTYFGPFNRRIDLPDIPAHSGVAVTLYHNQVPKPEERIIISTEETGIENGIPHENWTRG